MVRIGILSTASIVGRFVAASRECDNAQVVAIAARDHDRAKAFAAETGIGRVHESYEALLRDPDVDAVYIPLVNSLHHPYAMRALECGKHVLVEKPMCLRADDAREIFATARARGLFATETVKSPFLPVVQEVARILRSGELGRVREMDFVQSYAASPYTSGWNRELKMGGGCWIANEAYFLYLAELLGGRIEAWTGLASFGDSDVEEQCTALLRLAGDVVASCRISSHVVMENRLAIWCDGGSVVILDYWKAREALVRRADGSEELISRPCEHEMRYELEHYCACIEQGLVESPVTSAERTVRYLEVTSAVRSQMGLPDYPRPATS